MARLRAPEGGCPWDREQTFESISPYTIEEAYEVDDAIRQGDREALREELGELLLQVVYHAQMAEEEGSFSYPDVVASICEKLVRRHPHVFGDAEIVDAEAQTLAWDEHKARERAQKAERSGRPPSALDGVPSGLPALLRAAKLQRRAARAGLDDPDEAASLSRLQALLPEAADSNAIGDLLFACVRLAQRVGVDPENAARNA